MAQGVCKAQEQKLVQYHAGSCKVALTVYVEVGFSSCSWHQTTSLSPDTWSHWLQPVITLIFLQLHHQGINTMAI